MAGKGRQMGKHLSKACRWGAQSPLPVSGRGNPAGLNGDSWEERAGHIKSGRA